MRKLSIIALVVILAGALSVAAYGAENTNQVTVDFDANNTIGLKVVEGKNVSFGSNLDPTKTYYEKKATTLEVTSTFDNWEVTHEVGGTPSNPSEVLSIRYGRHSNWSKNSETYSGNSGVEQFDVSYKLDNLVGNLTQRANQLIVTFTVSS